MKLLIRFASRTEVVENVSVDDKCLPIVSGKRPYSPSCRDSSPLVRESSLWFKSLAVEAIYVDCSRRLIFWAPFVSAANTEDVRMRQAISNLSDTDEFVPATARPLYKDSSIYDFDASLKEMMSQCCEVARKFARKSLSVDEFHRVVAKILHVYILPSITFARDDMGCLRRAQCLIEDRLSKAEDDIKTKAIAIENLRNSLSKLKSNILLRENFESETYLRGCKRDFLVAFLKSTEADIDNLNIELSAAQRRVNWAKANPDEEHCLSEFKERRDTIFENIEKQIRVREAIKNVITRRELTKRKIRKKSEIVNSCFHNIFVEIIRRLETEDHNLCLLGNDKVTICAAREAVMCTILEISNDDRNSDRMTKFEPVNFVDYSFSEGVQLEKSRVWLTFQERVARALKDKFSQASRNHEDGCQRLKSKINLILSDFHMTKGESRSVRDCQDAFVDDDTSCQFSLSLGEVTLRNPTFNIEKSKRRDAVLINSGNELWSVYVIQPKVNMQKVQILDATDVLNELDPNNVLKVKDRRSSVEYMRNERKVDSTGESQAWLRLPRKAREDVDDDDFVDSFSENVGHDGTDAIDENECCTKRQRHRLKEHLALSTLLCDVDRMKDQIQAHFMEVIDCLDRELYEEEDDDDDEATSHEMRELLWRAYERFFCQKLYLQLMELYTTGLAAGIRKAHTALSRISLQEVLKEDKLLDLFFGQKAPIAIPSQRQTDKISITKTLSDLSMDVRRCKIDDLYSLANADSYDLRRRFDLESVDSEDGAKTSSCDSPRSYEKGAFGSANSGSLSSSLQSEVSVDSLDEDFLSESEKWRILSSPEKVDEIIDPVLSPFKKTLKKCLSAACFLDKVRYISKAIEGLNKDISQLIGPDFQSACDDIISMLVMALCNLSEDVFVDLYISLRLIVDVRPGFLSGTLWDYNLVSLLASYNYLFSLSVCDSVVRQYPESFKMA